mmetsp:Transcript_3203/g.5509  ORF Transcript_3203/g.5509 Transcript_3203/m.5509 type:complete len:813 (-) Transcript_3203:226-2664(-)
MSGETEEMTSDLNSVASNLLWADNPELEYFRYMLNESNMDDSLIGDSTLHEMLGGEEDFVGSSKEQSQQHLSPPKPNAVDTSGLSHAENDTIDNIENEDGSILAWFSRHRKHKKKNRNMNLGDDGTLDSGPVTSNPQQLDLEAGGPERNTQPQEPAAESQKLYKHENNIVEHLDVSREENIPGFIFVCGNSSTIQTRGSKSSKPKSSKKAAAVAEEQDEDQKSYWMSTKLVIICLVLALVLSAVMLAIVFTNRNSKSRGASAAQVGDSPPTSAPSVPSIVDTSAPSTSNPQQAPAPSGEAPTAGSTGSSPFDTFAPSASPSSTTATSLRPTGASTSDTPTASPTTLAPTLPTVLSRLEEFSSESVQAWLEPVSPQTQAAMWLSSDPEAQTYSDQKLIQQYVLATLYYSTNGDNWKSSTSWLVEGSDECTWWGIGCNSDGGIRSIDLANDNLSGPLPPEIHLLSDTLEEAFLNANEISSSIPSSIGRLKSLKRLQLTGNRLTGILPSSLGEMTILRNFSVKNNQLIGTLPELGSLSLLRNFDVSKNGITGTIPSSLSGMASLVSLHLSDNMLEGTIPAAMSQLTALTTLSFKRNNIEGTMPQGLCFVDVLTADCVEEIVCEPSCCSSCCVDGGVCVQNTFPPTFPTTVQSTAEPTMEVTTPPSIQSTPVATFQPTLSATLDATIASTEADTLSPTTSASFSSCSASISTDRSCYEDGDDIVISFVNCDPTEYDWIGIYPLNSDLESLGQPLAELWACGDPFCSAAVDVGTATFYNARGVGSFRVYLLRNGDSSEGPYLAYGIGNEFEMSSSCA